MALNIVIKPLAELDLEEAVQWHEELKEKLGEEFLYAFRDVLRVVAKTPLASVKN